MHTIVFQLDTPGMREPQILDDDGPGKVLDDLAEPSPECRFRRVL